MRVQVLTSCSCERESLFFCHSGTRSSPSLLVYAVLLLSLSVPHTHSQQQNVVSITPNVSAAQAGDSISQILSPSFAGLGIEPSNLFSFTGHDETNQLSVNLLANLANYSGVPPHLRVGGNSGDNFIWNADYRDFNIKDNPRSTGAGQVASDLTWFGPGYFQALERFPTNTPVTFGLNLAYDEPDYIQAIVNAAEGATSGLTNVDLVSFEVGNEPDLYAQNGFRTGTWDSDRYAAEWRERADAVYQQVLRPHNISSKFFEPTCTASTLGTSFELSQMAEQTNILAPASNALHNASAGYVAAWNQHDYYYYFNVSDSLLFLDTLMDLSTTVEQFSAWAIQVQQAFATGYSYVLREMASVGPTGAKDVSDVFGATLWTLNFFLYAATLNISSVEMHMTDNSFASPWQPNHIYGRTPHVRTTYYAWAAMDQLIGGGCTTRVSSMPVAPTPPGYQDRLVAYASYQQETLAALVLINTKLANTSQPNKGSIAYALSLPPLANQQLYLSYLTAPGADSKTDTVWNGLSYERSGDGTPTLVDGTIPTVRIAPDGAVSIHVRDTEAVVAAVGQQIGTGPESLYNDAACRMLGATRSVPRPDTIGGAASAGRATGPHRTGGGASPKGGAAAARGGAGSGFWRLLATVGGLFAFLA